MKEYFVYNTGTSGNDYTLYDNNVNGVHVPKQVVSIAGGAGLADKNLVTPMGVVTRITEDQLAVLKQIDLFQKHVDAGFLKVLEINASVDSVVPDMAQRDESAPLTDNDFDDEDETKAQPRHKKK